MGPGKIGALVLCCAERPTILRKTPISRADLGSLPYRCYRENLENRSTMKATVMSKLWLLALVFSAVVVHAAPQKLRLGQQDIQALVLKQGPEAQEVNDNYELSRFNQVSVYHLYDWTASLDYGY